MKYYKLINEKGYSKYTENKIYTENYVGDCYTIEELAKHYKSDWIEVPEYEYYLQEGLPEKWRTEDCEEVSKWAAKTFECCKEVQPNDYLHVDQSLFPSKNCYKFLSYKMADYTEITFETFKRLILKTENMEREIIGYKLKEDCENYAEAVADIAFIYSYKSNRTIKEINKVISTSSICKEHLEKAGVLNLWFEPVYAEEYKVGDWITYIGNKTTICTNGKAYKLLEIDRYGWIWHVCDTGERNGYNKKNYRKATPEEIKAAQYPQIEVNGYKGEFFDDYVKFGCAKIETAYILKINDILSNTYWKRSDYKTITSITIGKGTFTEEQIKLIAEYYINK